MPGCPIGKWEREKWLSQRLNESFSVERICNFVYMIKDNKLEKNANKTNIKFAKLRRDESFWFNITPNRLQEMDFFVWLCGTAEDYYVIPNQKMRQLVDANAGKWMFKKLNYPEFCFTTNHEFLPAKQDVQFYYRKSELLR